MKTIETSEFEAKCVQLMSEVSETGDVIVIAKNGLLGMNTQTSKAHAKGVMGKRVMPPILRSILLIIRLQIGDLTLCVTEETVP